MSSISLSITKDDVMTTNTIPPSLVVGTLAIGAGDIEVRVNLANAMTRQSVLHALRVLERYVENGYTDPLFPALPPV